MRTTERIIMEIEYTEKEISKLLEKRESYLNEIEKIQNLINNINFDFKNLTNLYNNISYCYSKLDSIENNLQSENSWLNYYYIELENSIDEKTYQLEKIKKQNSIKENLNENLKNIINTLNADVEVNYTNTNSILLKYNKNKITIQFDNENNKFNYIIGTKNISVKRLTTIIKYIQNDLYI